MKIIKLNNWNDSITKNFTGMIEYPNQVKKWYKEGKLHRTDGPAEIYSENDSCWFLEDKYIPFGYLKRVIKESVFLGKEKGKFDLEWLKFLTEDGIYEFPIIPGMTQDPYFIEAFLLLKEKHGCDVLNK